MKFFLCIQLTSTEQIRHIFTKANSKKKKTLWHSIMFSKVHCLIPNQHFVYTALQSFVYTSLWSEWLLTAHPLLLRGLILQKKDFMLSNSDIPCDRRPMGMELSELPSKLQRCLLVVGGGSKRTKADLLRFRYLYYYFIWMKFRVYPTAFIRIWASLAGCIGCCCCI